MPAVIAQCFLLLCLAIAHPSFGRDFRHEQYRRGLALPNQSDRTSPTYIWIELAFEVDKSSDPSDCFLQGSWGVFEDRSSSSEPSGAEVAKDRAERLSAFSNSIKP